MIRYTQHLGKEPPNGPYVMDDHAKSHRCHMGDPDRGKFVCTRPEGHDGVHEAGFQEGALYRCAASWM